MSSLDDSSLPPCFERAIDARDEADRDAVLQDLIASPFDQREAGALMDDIAGLRQHLLAGQPNPLLMSSLLAISQSHPKPQFDWREIADRPVNWRYIAACLAFAISLIAYGSWPQRVRGLQTLDTNVAQHVGSLALSSGRTLNWPASQSDPTQILAVWHECSLPFTPNIIQPDDPIRFVDGGAVAFDGNPALYTQWVTDGARYVMFQFDKKAIGLPEDFAQTTISLDRSGTHLSIWPGHDGRSGWALISYGGGYGNPFTDISPIVCEGISG